MANINMDFVPSLHFTAPTLEPSHRGGSNASELVRWLGRLEDILRRVVGSEARLWMCSAVAALSVPSDVQAASFLDLLEAVDSTSDVQSKRDASGEEFVTKQLVRMLCENCPRKVARLLAKDNKVLRRFFSGHPKRILGWFQNFAGAGETEHRLGARALARYAFMHRETCWHELEWKGKHSQAPATVASKPHYFAELDVLSTIDNFLSDVPLFWCSEELRDSLEEGEFLGLDVDFFIDELLRRMKSDRASNVWFLLKEYLKEESFSVLCQRTLHLVSDKALLDFLTSIRASFGKRGRNFSIKRDTKEREDAGRLWSDDAYLGNNSMETPWLETVFSAGVVWETLDDACFSNACANHWRDLSRLLQDQEYEQEAKDLRMLFTERHPLDEKDHWTLRQECILVKKWEAVKWLSLEAWLLFYFLSQESVAPESLERLMTEAGVGYTCSNPVPFEEYESDGDQRERRTGKERRRSGKRKRQKEKKMTMKKVEDSEKDEFESGGEQKTRPECWNNQYAISWRLSLDDFTITWTKVDVVEYLVRFSLRHWLMWTARRW